MPAYEHMHNSATHKTACVVPEWEDRTSHTWSQSALKRHGTMDSILLPPPSQSSFNIRRSQADLFGRTFSMLPSSCSTSSPSVHSTCDGPNRHQLHSAGDKTKPSLPRMRLARAHTIDISTLNDSNYADATEFSSNHEPSSQFPSTPPDKESTSAKGTYSNSIQITETDTSTLPSVKYDPNCAIDEKLLPLLALIVGEKLSYLTEGLNLSASVLKDAQATYSLPDTQALYILRVWVNKKQRKISDLLDALDRTGLKEVVMWAKAGRLEEFLHMQQEKREQRQAKWVSRFSSSLEPASPCFAMEHGIDGTGVYSGGSGVLLSQKALKRHDVTMSCTSSSSDISTLDGQLITSRNLPLLATSPSLTGTFSDMDTDDGLH